MLIIANNWNLNIYYYLCVHVGYTTLYLYTALAR